MSAIEDRYRSLIIEFLAQKTATKIGPRKYGKASPTNSTEKGIINVNTTENSTRNTAITTVNVCYDGLFHTGWYLCLLLQIAFYSGGNQLRATVYAVFHCFPKILSKCVNFFNFFFSFVLHTIRVYTFPIATNKNFSIFHFKFFFFKF